MQEGILIAHVVVGVLFILFVLLQDKGTGFGSALGGSGGDGFYASQRGAAKVLHNLSVFLASAFLLTAVVYVVLPTPGPTVDVDSVGADSATTVDSDGVPIIPIDANSPGVVATPVSPDAPGVELGGVNASDSQGASVNIVSPEATE